MADANELHETISRLEAERDSAQDKLDQIADEGFDSPDEESAWRERFDAAEREVERIAEAISDAENDFRLALDDSDEDDPKETPSVWDAADIWRSHGEDSNYMFGYSENELRRAADHN